MKNKASAILCPQKHASGAEVQCAFTGVKLFNDAPVYQFNGTFAIAGPAAISLACLSAIEWLGTAMTTLELVLLVKRFLASEMGVSVEIVILKPP